MLCEDHVGTYRLPWPCRSTPEGLRNERTGELTPPGVTATLPTVATTLVAGSDRPREPGSAGPRAVRILHVVTAWPRDPEDVITPWLVTLAEKQAERGHDVDDDACQGEDHEARPGPDDRDRDTA